MHIYIAFVILDCFLHFYPPMDQENQSFEMKKTAGDIFILQMCTINENNMMYGSSDMEQDNFLSFGTVFCAFTPPPPIDPENQNFGKMKKMNLQLKGVC